MANDYIFTSESVSEGHPDKMADQISDAVLDSILAEDKNARVACETMVKTGLVVTSPAITTSPVFTMVSQATLAFLSSARIESRTASEI